MMLRIASLYARRVQSHLSATGHLFERRYHAILIDADEYLLTLLRYIHLNPVRARLVDAPTEYRWSSHADYLGTVERAWVTTAFALSLFHAEPARAQSVYQTMVLDDLKLGIVAPFDQLNVNDRRILGNDGFLAHLQGLAWRPKSRKRVEGVIDDVCREFKVDVAHLQSRSAKRLLAQARAWVAHHCVEHRIASVSEVARRFGRDESTLRESMLRYFPSR